eukprot:RCo023317
MLARQLSRRGPPLGRFSRIHRLLHGSGLQLKEPLSKFADLLLIDIKARGPLSLATFMTEALTNPMYGYYTTRPEVLGKSGDFVTSPEISQMFGELVGIWCVSVWEALGKPKAVTLVELGPGRGVLMADVLRTAKRFAPFFAAVSVCFLELHSPLREAQQKALKEVAPEVAVSWVDHIDQFPTSGPLIVIAHEFFDALPIHRFQKTDRGWCEILVEMDEDPRSEHHFRFVTMNRPTLRNVLVQDPRLRSSKVGESFETSPRSLLIVDHLLRLLSKQKGAALVVDYGIQMGWVQDSLRGIRNHKPASVLGAVGETDLSADVDFVGFRSYARTRQSVTKVASSEIITQRDFLVGLGIDLRLLDLLTVAELENTSSTLQMELAQGYQRLIDPEGMGGQYKVLCFYHESLAPGPPPWS